MTPAEFFSVLMVVLHGFWILVLFRAVLELDRVPVTWTMLTLLMVGTGLFAYLGYAFDSPFHYALAATTVGAPTAYLGMFSVGLCHKMRNR